MLPKEVSAFTWSRAPRIVSIFRQVNGFVQLYQSRNEAIHANYRTPFISESSMSKVFCFLGGGIGFRDGAWTTH
jgi:hypothetical protein